MWSGTKRKVEAFVGYVLPAVVDRAISKAVEWYEARTSVDDQLPLQRLRMLSIKLHSAVEAADGVHIRSWWLRRWLWTLRDAALDADELLQLFRQRRAAGETDAASHRSAKSLLFWRDDSGSERLSHMVARLEREAMGLSDFLKMLELQIKDEVVPLQASDFGRTKRRKMMEKHGGHVVSVAVGDAVSRTMSAAVGRYEARAIVDEQLERRHMLLVIVRHVRLVLGNLAALILRAAGRLIRKPTAPPPLAMIRDAGELLDLVARIQRAVHDARHVELRGKRSWLDMWRGELQAVASRADRVLLTIPVKATPDGIHFVDEHVGEEVWRTAQIVEAAAAHLEDFVTLVGLARRQIRARPSTRRSIPRISSFLLTLFSLVILSVCVAGVAIYTCFYGCLARQRLRTGGPPVTGSRRYLCAVCQL